MRDAHIITNGRGPVSNANSVRLTVQSRTQEPGLTRLDKADKRVHETPS